MPINLTPIGRFIISGLQASALKLRIDFPGAINFNTALPYTLYSIIWVERSLFQIRFLKVVVGKGLYIKKAVGFVSGCGNVTSKPNMAQSLNGQK